MEHRDKHKAKITDENLVNPHTSYIVSNCCAGTVPLEIKVPHAVVWAQVTFRGPNHFSLHAPFTSGQDCTKLHLADMCVQSGHVHSCHIRPEYLRPRNPEKSPQARRQYSRNPNTYILCLTPSFPSPQNVLKADWMLPGFFRFLQVLAQYMVKEHLSPLQEFSRQVTARSHLPVAKWASTLGLYNALCLA